MNSIKSYIAGLPPMVQGSICIALTVLVGIIDHFSGDYGITVAYILPIYVSAKLLGRRNCLYFTVICILELLGSALIPRQLYSTFLDVVFWNTILQSTELGITGYLISLLTSQLPRPNIE